MTRQRLTFSNIITPPKLRADNKKTEAMLFASPLFPLHHGTWGTRTLDILHVKQALSQLS